MPINPGLKAPLDRLYLEYNREGRLSDPIERVRPFRDPADAEIVAFCAAGLAFGRVAGILASVDALIAVMGESPAAYVRAFEPRREAPRLAHLGHRWTRAPDLVALLWVLRQMLDTAGSIEQFFLDGDDPSSADIRPGLESFCLRARQFDVTPAYRRALSRPGVHGFFARPSSGSACKRLNLFLRWMVRRDRIDLGVWSRVSPSRLVVPLDVHVVRVGRCLGLTARVSPGWRMAAEITAALRQIDPADPVRYDFALCHIGMLGLCGFNQQAGDSRCPLQGACGPHRRTPRASRRSSDRS